MVLKAFEVRMFTGSWEWLIVLAILLLLFGGSKLPKLGGALGESIRNFKRGLQGKSAPDQLSQDSRGHMGVDPGSSPPPDA